MKHRIAFPKNTRLHFLFWKSFLRLARLIDVAAFEAKHLTPSAANAGAN